MRSWFHYVVSADTSGRHIVRTFYPETGRMTSKITYKSNETKVKNGDAIEWYDDGSRRYQGAYLNDKAEGIWKTFNYETDILSDSGRYESDQKQGTWQFFDNIGRLEWQYEYINDIRDGNFQRFDTLGIIVNSGIYKADTIFQQSNPPSIDIDEVQPVFALCIEQENTNNRDCGSAKMMRYINDNFNYPSMAIEYGIQGTAYIHFVVDKNGKVKNVEVMKGLCDAVKKECKRLIENMPDWEQAGEQAGEPVSVRYIIPIKLRLG